MISQLRHLPNFFILGAKRAGTASLAHYLGQHPEICMTDPRDPSFFLRDELYCQGIDYYIRTFCRDNDTQAWLGDGSPAYFAHPHLVGARLRHHYGDTPLKFIVVLREPVSRAWSHYLTRVHHGIEKRDFAMALAQENDASTELEARYFGEGRYAHLLAEWQQYFPPESFLLLLSEDLAANPLAQVRRVFLWMGVDTAVPINVSKRLNPARYSYNPRMVEFLNHPPTWIRTFSKRVLPEDWKRRRIREKLRERFQKSYGTLPPLDPDIAAELRQRYRGEILALSKVLGRYLSHWLAETELEDAPAPEMAYMR